MVKKKKDGLDPGLNPGRIPLYVSGGFKARQGFEPLSEIRTIRPTVFIAHCDVRMILNGSL